MSGASERVNGQASGPVLTSLFVVDPDHSAMVTSINDGICSDKQIVRTIELTHYTIDA